MNEKHQVRAIVVGNENIAKYLSERFKIEDRYEKILLGKMLTGEWYEENEKY